MNLTNDTEKNYFKALIEKSRLIKDEVRGDLVQFLRNPKQPGSCDIDNSMVMYLYVFINYLT